MSGNFSQVFTLYCNEFLKLAMALNTFKRLQNNVSPVFISNYFSSDFLQNLNVRCNLKTVCCCWLLQFYQIRHHIARQTQVVVLTQADFLTYQAAHSPLERVYTLSLSFTHTHTHFSLFSLSAYSVACLQVKLTRYR